VQTKNSRVLARAVEAVVFLFAAFSGFLTGIAPPEEAAQFSVGAAAMLALCLFLFISIHWKKKPRPRERRLWLVLAGSLMLVAAIAGLSYRYNLDVLTFAYPPDYPTSRYFAGTQYTPEASSLADKEGLSAGQVVAKFGGLPNRHLVWNARSVERARLILVTNYLIFALSIAGTVFSLVELKTR